MSFSLTDNELKHKIFHVTEHDFDQLALEVFRFQYRHNEVYRNYADLLKKYPSDVQRLQDIPFLPVSFFKTHKVIAAENHQMIFESSSTTNQTPGKHYVADTSLYEESFLKCFQQFFGSPKKYCMLMLLPSYLEREHSSLVYMAKHLVEHSKHLLSSFYLYDYDKLQTNMLLLEKQGQPYILLGVTFALLDFSKRFQVRINHGLVIETGGMKGRGKEMIREELHAELNERFGTTNIFSEYGMTELLSQAYMKEDGKFHCPPWMKVLARDVYNPLQLLEGEQQGGINVIDLANLYSCSFVETGDTGRVFADGSFEISGRLDNSEIRGCNLMVN